MILYQLAKWMEERTHLLLRMQERGANRRALAEQKAVIERRMLRQAELWREGRYQLAIPEPDVTRDMSLPQIALSIQGVETTPDEAGWDTRLFPPYLLEELEATMHS